MTITKRIQGLDWAALTTQLDEQGFVQTPAIYGAAECSRLAKSFENGDFRSSVDMRRHRFGEGEYKYFDAPLPDLIDEARHGFYPPLAELANEWGRRLGQPDDYPGRLADFLERCHRAGQNRPTPLILRYFEGGHNTLHQDLYGDIAFPLQVVTMLDRPGRDFEGGQFVLVEQRPRAQSRAPGCRGSTGGSPGGPVSVAEHRDLLDEVLAKPHGARILLVAFHRLEGGRPALRGAALGRRTLVAQHHPK